MLQEKKDIYHLSLGNSFYKNNGKIHNLEIVKIPMIFPCPDQFSDTLDEFQMIIGL